ncbi:4-alpha-glucanotransferase [Rubritalea tangerina]|uniref:4-alpha-glucanotransferase n=1 Tax=Rubritalea tangerina TaxID=430798 RepID=A0ABW4ZBX2_9BACT
MSDMVSAGRSAGVLFPVFSMRRKNDLGIGDTRAVKQCLDWFAAHGVGFLQLLPINVTGSDRSPYSAISSVALDPLYLDLEQIKGVGRATIRRAREASGIAHIAASVDYATVWKVKSEILSMAFGKFCKSGGDEGFERFKRSQGKWLKQYCLYRWLIDEAGGEEDWSLWPEAFNTQEGAYRYEAKRLRKDRAEVRTAQNYYAWEQWHAFAQWEGVRAHADRVGVRLMGDVPIGVSYASADVFFEPEWFHLDLFGGAPPETEFKADAFTTKWGQNWGVPVYRWDVIEKSDYAWWRRRIGALSSIFHQFRIDHILGFYRIYSFPWHPRRNAEFLPLSLEEAARETGGRLPGFFPREDDTMVHKALNLLDGDKYIRAVREAAGDAEVIGEDLGTVPDYVRPHLLESGIAGFKICHWEVGADGNVIDGSAYPECSFACYTTHDMAPIRSQWEDYRVAAEAGDRVAEAKLKAISQFAGLPVMRKGKAYPAFSHKTKHALLDALMGCRSRYAGVMINGVGDSPMQINFPGTVGDQNWTYRVSWEFEHIPRWMEKEMVTFEQMLRKHDRWRGA